MRIAFGLKARTGKAVLIALGGNARDPQFIERTWFRTLPEGAFAPYHVAEELPPDRAEASLERDIAAAHRLAQAGVRDAAQRATAAGHKVRGCGVLVGTGMPDWTTREIVAVHIRMHKAEGELFRNVLVAAARACELPLVTLPEKSAFEAAAKKLRVTATQLEARIATIGKQAGSPWTAHEKQAAAAALVALAARP